MSTGPSSRARVVQVGLVMLLAAPIHSVSHEAAHYLFARAFGWRPTLMAARVFYSAGTERAWQRLDASGQGTPQHRRLAIQRTVVFSAGLVANLAVSLAGLGLLAASRRADPPRGIAQHAGAVLGLSAIILVMDCESFIRLGTRASPDLDRLAATWHVSSWPLHAASGIVGCVACLAVILLFTAERRRLFVPVALAGGAISYAL